MDLEIKYTMRHHMSYGRFFVGPILLISCGISHPPSKAIMGHFYPPPGEESIADGSPKVIIRIKSAPGTPHKGSLWVAGREHSPQTLRTLLHEKAANARDDEGLPTVTVEIDVEHSVEWKYVNYVIYVCMAESVWKIWFSRDIPQQGRWGIAVNLPTDLGKAPARAKRAAVLGRTPEHPKDPDDLNIYLWRSSDPDQLHIGLNQQSTPNIASIEDLAEKLHAIRNALRNALGGYPLPVIVQARPDVKFRDVFGAIKVCKRAGIKNIYLQTDSVPRDGIQWSDQ